MSMEYVDEDAYKYYKLQNTTVAEMRIVICFNPVFKDVFVHVKTILGTSF